MPNTLKLSELRSATRHLINDLRAKPIKDSDVDEAVNKAAKWVGGHGLCLQKYTLLPTEAGVQYVDVPDGYIDIENAVWDFYPSPGIGEGRDQRSIEIKFNLDMLGHKKYSYDADIPTDAAILNIHTVYPWGDKIWFDIVPIASTIAVFGIMYYAFPAKLSNDNDFCEILFPWVDLIPNRAGYLLALRVEQYERAGVLMNNSEDGLGDLQSKYTIRTRRMREKAKYTKKEQVTSAQLKTR